MKTSAKLVRYEIDGSNLLFNLLNFVSLHCNKFYLCRQK